MNLKPTLTNRALLFLLLSAILTLLCYLLLFTSSDLYFHKYITRDINGLFHNWTCSQFAVHNESLSQWIPQNDDSLLLQSLSSNFQKCHKDNNNKKDPFMVILVLNRITSSQQRYSIRSTYANETAMNRIRNQFKPEHEWALFFIVGRPDNDYLEQKISLENAIFQDIIVVNASEGYFYTTVKMVIGIKVIAKFCPDVKYVIKTDDDVYLRIAKLEQVILKMQQMVNWKAKDYGSHGRKKSVHLHDGVISEEVSFYSGAVCENFTTLRSGRWAVRMEEYPYPNYPLYCSGVLNIFSQHTIQRMAQECPYHCIGEGTFYPKQSKSHLTTSIKSRGRAEHCFYRFEDTFLGSCVNSLRNPSVIITPIHPRIGLFFTHFNEAKKSHNISLHIGVHTAANDGMVDEEINGRVQSNSKKRDFKSGMEAAHEFYTHFLV